MVEIGLSPEMSNFIVYRFSHPIPGLEVVARLSGLMNLKDVLNFRMFPNASSEQGKHHGMIVRSNVWIHLLKHHVKLVNKALEIKPLHLEVVEMTNVKIRVTGISGVHDRRNDPQNLASTEHSAT